MTSGLGKFGVAALLACAAILPSAGAAGARTAVAITPDRPVVPDRPLAGDADHGRGRPTRVRTSYAAPRARRTGSALQHAGSTGGARTRPWTVAADSGDSDIATVQLTEASYVTTLADAPAPADAPASGVRALVGAEPVTASDAASVVEVGVTDGPSLGEGSFILLVNRSSGGKPSGGGRPLVNIPGPVIPWAGHDPLTCMTQAVYFEARGEPLEGQEGVAQVVMNRTQRAQYPGDVCGVVFQGANRVTGCQFSFACDGAMNRPLQPDAWGRAEEVAQRALDGFVYEPLRDATHFHATYVSPYWSSTRTRIRRIGGHIFYQ